MWKKPSKTKEPENKEKAYEYAVFLLSLQLRTVGEIREKMEKRGYTPAIIESVLEQLHDQKYLDDERYAEVFLDNLKQYKNLGYFGIKKKFLLKKLPSDLIEKVLEEGLSKEDELKIARRYCSSLSRTKTNLASRPGSKTKFVDESSDITYNTYDEELTKQKQKLFAKLKSRGFRGDVIAKLIL